MGVNTFVTDPGTSVSATVSSRSLHVIQHPGPPRDLGNAQELVPFRQNLSSNGLQTGTISLVSNGSVVPVEFYVGSNLTLSHDRYINVVQFELTDAGGTLNEFGALTALTNGCDILWVDPTLGTVSIFSALKTNWEMIRAGVPENYGGGSNAFKATNVRGTDEGFLANIRFRDVFGFPNGLRFPAGGNSRLILRVNDDLTGLDYFQAVAYGFEHILDPDGQHT